MLRSVATVFVVILPCFLFVEQSDAGCGFGRGKPKAECGGWIIFSTAAFYRMADSDLRPGKEPTLATGDIGYMRNLRERDAVGASLSVGLDGDGARLAILARYRRFISDRIGLDLGIGPSLGYLARSVSYVEGSGLIVQGGISAGDWVSLMVQMQRTVYHTQFDYSYNAIPAGDRTQTEYYAGLRFGSYASPAVPVGFVAAFGIWLLAGGEIGS